MAFVRVEGILGHKLVVAEWHDGEVTGDPVLLATIERLARRAGGGGRRFYDDPLAFAALASQAVERYGEGPARVTAEGIAAALEDGMTGLGAGAP